MKRLSNEIHLAYGKYSLFIYLLNLVYSPPLSLGLQVCNGSLLFFQLENEVVNCLMSMIKI